MAALCGRTARLLAAAVLLGCVLALPSFGQPLPSLNWVTVPEDAWTYWEAPSTHWGEIDYYPTSVSEFSSGLVRRADPTLGDYVQYSNSTVPQFGPIYIWSAPMYHVFETYAYSAADVSIPIRIGGDDAASLFVNDVFVGGDAGPFSLNLPGGEWVKLDLVGHDAMDLGWIYGIHIDNGTSPTEPGAPIQSYNVRIRAEVPEPGVALVCCLGTMLLVALSFRRRAVARVRAR